MNIYIFDYFVFKDIQEEGEMKKMNKKKIFTRKTKVSFSIKSNIFLYVYIVNKEAFSCKYV